MIFGYLHPRSRHGRYDGWPEAGRLRVPRAATAHGVCLLLCAATAHGVCLLLWLRSPVAIGDNGAAIGRRAGRFSPPRQWLLLGAVAWALTAGTYDQCVAWASDDTRQTTSSPPSAESRLADVKEQAEALKKEQYAVATQLLKDYPDDFNAFRVLGYVHSCHGNLGEMSKCWQRCRELRPDRADIYDQLGRHAVQIERYQDAIGYWQKALEIDPRFPGAFQRIGYAYLDLGRPQEAVTELQREIANDPQASQAFFLLGEAFFQLQDFAQAKDNYLAAVQIEPQHSHAYYGLIKTCARLGRSEEAATYAKAFQQLESAAVRQDAEIRGSFDDLQQMKDRLAGTLVDAGRVYQIDKNLAQAEQLWKRGAAIDPKNTVSGASAAGDV